MNAVYNLLEHFLAVFCSAFSSSSRFSWVLWTPTATMPSYIEWSTHRSVSVQEASTTTWMMWAKILTTTPSLRCWGTGASETSSRFVVCMYVFMSVCLYVCIYVCLSVCLLFIFQFKITLIHYILSYGKK